MGPDRSHCLRVGLASLLLATAGCYTYHPIQYAQVQPGSRVRAHVTPEEAQRIAEFVGYTTRDLDGQVVSHDDGSLLLEVPAQTALGGADVRRFVQRVDIPQSSLVEIEQRRLNTAKTFVTIGAAAAVASFVVISQFGSNGSGTGAGGKGGINHSRVPVLRLHFPIR